MKGECRTLNFLLARERHLLSIGVSPLPSGVCFSGNRLRHIPRNRQTTSLLVMFGWEVAITEIAVPHFFEIIHHYDTLRFVAVGNVLCVAFQQPQQVRTA